MKNKYIYITIVSALSLGIAQHFSVLGFLAWFCLIPLFFIIHDIDSYGDIIKYTFIWGLVYHLTTMFWLASNVGTDRFSAIISMIATILYLSTNTVIIGIVWYRLKIFFEKYSILLFIITWTCVEFIKSYGILAFPWVSIANSQTNYFYLIQIVEYVGIYGITFWILSVNGFIYYLLRNRFSYKNIIIGIFIFIIPFLLGYLSLIKHNNKNNDDYQVSLVQPNIKLADSRDYSKTYILLDLLLEETQKCINEGSNLIIWPEAALPFHSLQNKKTLDYINNKLLNKSGVSILSGDIIFDKEKTYNGVVLFDESGVKEIYKKQLPVPLAEQVPLSDVFPKLQNINIGVANFSSGIEDVVFKLDDKKFSSLICYESTFPGINRRHVKKGAQFITFLVNDAWYTNWPEPEQHAKQSIFRAIENRKTVLRCANTGISLVVSPYGEITNRINLNEKGLITTNINTNDYITFYTKFGNVFVYILLIIVTVLLLRTIIRNEKEL